MSNAIPGLTNTDHIGFTVPGLAEAVSFLEEHFGVTLLYESGPFLSSDDCMAASPDYLYSYVKPCTPEDLEQHNCLVFKGTQGVNRWFIGKEQLAVIDVGGSLYSNNAETLVASAVGEAVSLFCLPG
ncbi:LysR substrate-binding domain-containing protein [Salinimonas lutimaris]|uniref:LysR substrate-binding domain-containing protein n=1 Tax=Salinimonas lutimaris TaxID=914153 RepID=UPI001C30DE13|nr:LysR substrate-binding domain-containing protein [Salinimonas lutimaris]